MICNRCGYSNKEESKFCKKCGQKLMFSTPSAGAFGSTLSDGFLLQGRYKIVKQLGKGGMGVVYLANDNRFSNRVCVVKELIDFYTDEANKHDAIIRFAQEADLLATINHSNVPQVYDRFSEGNRHYLVMEFVSGMDLREILDEFMREYKSPLPEEDVILYFMQLCLTLKYLHGNKPPILHRDIKPPNILLTREGKVKLVDFGIAKAIQTNTRGTSIGTQGYAAPEQYKGLSELRTDIYSLGATIHHLLTGRDPQMETPFDFPAVKDININVSKELSDIISWMLEMDINSRPHSIIPVIDRIKAFYPDIEQKVLNPELENNKITGIIAKRFAVKDEAVSAYICTFCGNTNKAVSKFCVKCGKPLGNSSNLNIGSGNNIAIKMVVAANSKILKNYTEGYGQYIKIPDKNGNIRTNIILQKYFFNGNEYFYLTEKTPSIIGQEVFVYNVIKNERGVIEYIKPVTDSSIKTMLYNYWCQL